MAMPSSENIPLCLTSGGLLRFAHPVDRNASRQLSGLLELLHLVAGNVNHLILLASNGHDLRLLLLLLRSKHVAGLGHDAHPLRLLGHAERLLGVHGLLETAGERLLGSSESGLTVRRLKLRTKDN